MDFQWSSEQQNLHKAVVDFAMQELDDDVEARDQRSVFAHDLWCKCADYGVLSWAVPTELGGRGYDPLTSAYLMEALGYGCRDNGLTFALGAQMWGVQMALAHFASPDQIAQYLTPMMQGKSLAAYAITEPTSGSDAFALQTTASKLGDHYILNGEKTLITLAPLADFAIVFAATDSAAGRWGLSAFLVDSNTNGFEVGLNEPKMGLRTVPFGSISMTDCRVPATALLGKEGAGAAIFSYSQGWERSLVLAPQIGVMQHLMERCIAYAKGHHRGGSAIGSYQSISNRIADMAVRTEASRMLLYKTAWLLSSGKPGLLEAAVTKTYLGEAFCDSARESIAIHGGAGYKTNAGIERNLRDAIGGTIYGGTSDIQRNIIAAWLGVT